MKKRLLPFAMALLMLFSVTNVLAETTIPVVEEPVTMSLYFVYKAGGVRPSENIMWQKVEEMTGIHWELTEVDASEASEKMNLVFASGELPDVFFNFLSMSQIAQYNKNGYFIDMTDLIAEYAPNLTRLMETSEAVRGVMTLPNGQISSLVWTNMQIEYGSDECPLLMPYINAAWLDKLGLEIPQSFEEFYDVMLAFRDKDPNENGEADEIPMAAVSLNDIISVVGAWHGFLIDNNTKAFLDGDTVIYVPTTEAFKETVKIVAQMYADRLIDQDIVTLTGNQIIAKGSEETSIYGTQFCSGNAYWGTHHSPEYAVLPIYRVYEDKEAIWTGRQYANAGSFCITKNCKTPELAMQWADLFYSEEFVNWYWMGLEGESYAYNEDGTWNWILGEGETVTDVRNYKCLQSLNLGPSMCPTDWFKINDPVESVVNADRIAVVESAPGACRLALPVMYYDDNVSKEISILTTDLNAYYSETIAKFVVGELDIDANWDEFVNTLNRMGAEDLISYLQDTYDQNHAA